ncbi:DUF1351 domain-containing protein [Streptococcus danieliae]|uniref:DUF1351 domain-containing protein n=1 Tax=Streptococcus danieliae TaxID=747656 RepID=UPI0021C9E29E|nr:DUF1351 domain-containing protein [Streptococcus danieliae]MCU0082473.1 DUF1351 domain-containing protein [Streptococcus danieliae]
MQELQVKLTQAQVEIIDREKFEQGINEVVVKYENYTVTAATIKDDKQVLADLRKLKKQISDERIKIKNELSQPVTDFDKYIKGASEPIDKIIEKIAKDVKEYEEHQKAVRLDTVKAYISNKASEYGLDPRIFDSNAGSFLKASDFMADGFTLKKATMKSLDEIIVAEFEKQQEFEKAKSAIAGQCSEYGMTDQPYIRMLSAMTLPEVLEQIKADYRFELQKAELRRNEEEDQRRIEEQKARQQGLVQKSTETPNFDPETGEILEGGQLYQNDEKSLTGAKNSPKRYTQKMKLEVYFEDSRQKEFFKSELAKIGFVYKENYAVNGYKNIPPLTEDELRAELN